MMAALTLSPEQLGQFPTHLALSLQVLLREYDEKDSFRTAHRLIDAVEVLCKTYTVASLGTFLYALRPDIGEEESTEEVEKIKVQVASGLRTPSLGQWWSFARDTGKLLQKFGIAHAMPGAGEAVSESRAPLFKAFENEKKNLLSFRNQFAHGATPSQEVCLERLRDIVQLFIPLVQGPAARPLLEARLVVCLRDGRTLLARGLTLQEIECDAALLPRHLYFEEGGRWIDVYPLLAYQEEEGHFYFYNDQKKNSKLNFLNYPQARHRQDIAGWSELLVRVPIDEWKKINNPALVPFQQYIESLTEEFKGRLGEFEKIAHFLKGRSKGFLTYWGPPGAGKSALMARLVQMLRTTPEQRSALYPGVEWPALGFFVLEYFIRRGKSDTSQDFLDSLNQRLDQMFGLQMELGSTDKERQQGLEARLAHIATTKLKEGQRLLLVVDGLDEASPDSRLIDALPRAVPDKVFVLYGSRPKPYLQQYFYGSLEREHREERDLTGLAGEDIRAILSEHVNKYELAKEYIEAVLIESGGNPLYLQLLCRGLEAGNYRLNAIQALPEVMEDLYKNELGVLKSAPAGDQALDFLCLLAAAKDFVPLALAEDILGVSNLGLKLDSIREFLFENPLTADVLDYQLFHESLREYLWAGDYRSKVLACQSKLADYCCQWKAASAHTGEGPSDLRWPPEARAYAMRHAFRHLFDTLQEHDKQGDRKACRTRARQILELIEDADWRAKNYQTLGNGYALQEAYAIAQRVLMAYSEGEPDHALVLDYAYRMHQEPLDLYNAQRERLREGLGHRGLRSLEEVAEIAKIGATPREKVLLVLSALWTIPIQIPIPEVLTNEVQGWLTTAKDEALDKLWAIQSSQRI
jgi:hypothetical protein